ncbi:MAG: LysM peptidoglycan-binding domain-containing protein, partial [Chloroflexota bacterium]
AADTSARPDGPGRPGASGTTRGGRRRPPGRAGRWRRLVAVVLAGAVLVGALWLASPGVVDWMRNLGTGAGAASPSAPIVSPAPIATPSPGATPTAPPAATASSVPGATSTPSPATPAPSATTVRSAAPAATPLVHVVVWGETLFAIAAKYGVPMESIAKANGLTDPGLIHPGQHLVIPAQ